MTEREKRDKIIENLEWAIGDEDVYDCLHVDDLEGVMDTMKDALTLIKALDVTPEELERLKLCRHECKVDCLLESFNRVVEERDTLLKDREPRILTVDEMKSWDKDVWVEDYGVNEVVVIDASIAQSAMAFMSGKFRIWTARPTAEQMEATPWC